MSQELRVKIDDELHSFLKTLCTEQGLTFSQAVAAIIRQAQIPNDAGDTKLDAVLLQLQRVQMLQEAMLEVLVFLREHAAPAAEKAPPVPTYDDFYGPITPIAEEKGNDQIPEYFRPPQKRGLLTRLLYKVED